MKFPVKKIDYDDEGLSDEERMRLRSVWKTKQRRPDDYLVGRKGEHLMIPFECDYCIFRKLQGRIPLDEKVEDQVLLDFIRRANLDACWSRARSTVEGNAKKADMMCQFADELNLSGLFVHSRGVPTWDYCGYQIAIIMLRYSLRQGKYDSHLQIESVRKLRSVYSNFIRCSPDSIANQYVLQNAKGQYQRLTNDICGSLWFTRFMEGMRKRMGYVSKPNKTLRQPLLRKLLEMTDLRIRAEVDNVEERDKWVVFNTYVVISYVISLRGSEGFLLDLGRLRSLWSNGKGSYVTIPLFGKFKTEDNEACHLIPCSETTGSGINLRHVLNRLIVSKQQLGIVNGPGISDNKGFVIDPAAIDEMLHEILCELFNEHPTLFPPGIENENDIKEGYQCFRTFRRSSVTRATEMKVSKSDKDIVNRWRMEKDANGNKVNLEMHQHYTNFDDLLLPFLRYTKAM